MPARYQTGYQIGRDNTRRWGMDIHHPVFWIAAFLIVIFVLGTLMAPGPAKGIFAGAKGWSIAYFDWLFMVGGNVFVLFCLALIFLPVGKIRIGGIDARPEFSTLSWFSMLFAAGMGIGLMFWSVAEPTAYYTNWYGTPLNAVARTPAGADAALEFHLPEAILGVDEAHRECRIIDGFGVDMRYSMIIADNLHVAFEAGQLDVAIELGQRAARP